MARRISVACVSMCEAVCNAFAWGAGVSGFPQYVYDPIHGLIRFDDTGLDRMLIALVNTREFQRLRRIKQLGMTSLVFPGANHNRFSHALGVMHLSRRFLKRLEYLQGEPIPDVHRAVVLVAALLHDIGHGPFSHVFEKVSGEDHEKRTEQVILDATTEVNARLREYDAEFPALVAQFFQEDPDEGNGEVVPALLTGIVSSQMDADRFDYLIRDSHFTGVNYGKFDHEWLIEHLEFDLKAGPVLSHKAFEAAETYVFARYHMYRAVYFHKTTRAGEIMLRTLFKRYKHLIAEGAVVEELVPDAPTEVQKAFGTGLGLDEYLDLDDDVITVFFKRCCHSSDPILGTIGEGLLNRHLWKCVDISDDMTRAPRVQQTTMDVIAQMGLGDVSDFSHAFDTPGDTPYKPYSPTVDAVPILVRMKSGDIRELSTESSPVQQLKKYEFMRYYFPQDVYEKVKAAL